MIPKFRAYLKGRPYLKGTGIIVDVQEINYKYEEIVYENGRYTEVADFKDIKLLQSTGLKDKNGIEIFYDDIVKVSYKEHSYVSYITYEFHETTIEGKYIHEDFHYYENPLYIIFEDDDKDHTIEVIGNIYEHPHLLKE